MWYTYALGFLYALGAGLIFIKPAADLMDELVQPNKPQEHVWQTPIIATIERVLYISSLLMGYAAFIAFWVGLKIAIDYPRWRKNRTIFLNSLTGNGLSILYAVVGYMIIVWMKSKDWAHAIVVPVLLILGNISLLLYLKWQGRKAKPLQKPTK